MTFLLLLPVLLSALLMAAHFLYGDNLPLMALSLALPLLLFIRRRWVAWLMQLLLLLAAVEWLRRLVVLIQERQARAAMGEPVKVWTCLYILGPVILFTALSALVFETPRLRRRYE